MVTPNNKNLIPERRGERSKQVTISIRCLGVMLSVLAIFYVYFIISASKGMIDSSKTTSSGAMNSPISFAKNTSLSGKSIKGIRPTAKEILKNNIAHPVSMTKTVATRNKTKQHAIASVIDATMSKKTSKFVPKVTNDIKLNNRDDDGAITIGFASTVTGCGEEPFTEGGAVLKHSIHRASIHGTLGGRYDYRMYVIYHPNATECTMPLADLGFELIKRDTPVNVSDIQGDFLRERIVRNGCCGEKELIKLEAYTLLQHPIIVLVDLDVLVLQPMDSVFDLMLSNDPNPDTSNVPLMWPDRPLPKRINIFWTKDYNVVGPGRKDKPTQGGLLIIRPSLDVYNEFIQIVREGDYHEKHGWGMQVGPFYGGMTIQGLIPYYYEYLHNETGGGIELNRCIYNQMADNPTTKPTVNDIPQGNCRTAQEVCEDCRARPIEDIVTFHYTICQKPWRCLPQKQNKIQMRLCRKAIHEWFLMRSDLEQSWGRVPNGTGSWEKDQFLGFCHKFGFEGYQQIKQPYGLP